MPQICPPLWLPRKRVPGHNDPFTMTHTVQIGAAQLACADSLQFIKTIPDASLDLICTDPPYFRVKENEWDRQWSSDADYLAWLEAMVAEFRRVLKPTGSLFMFCGHRLAADTEIMVRRHLNVLNHIIWAKPSGVWGRNRKEAMRQFFPSTERVIFADHHGERSTAPGGTGYGSKMEELRREVFSPIISYFADARAALNVAAKEINDATGTQMCSHWFSGSQWQLPKEEQYAQLQALFAGKAASSDHPGLPAPYAALEAQYTQLLNVLAERRREGEAARRFFTVTKAVPFLDVWNYPVVQGYPGKHPCEKPAAMMADIINATSRPGDMLADFFMGSGSFVKQALKLGRRVIGVELDPVRFSQTATEVADVHREVAPSQTAAPEDITPALICV